MQAKANAMAQNKKNESDEETSAYEQQIQIKKKVKSGQRQIEVEEAYSKKGGARPHSSLGTMSTQPKSDNPSGKPPKGKEKYDPDQVRKLQKIGIHLKNQPAKTDQSQASGNKKSALFQNLIKSAKNMRDRSQPKGESKEEAKKKPDLNAENKYLDLDEDHLYGDDKVTEAFDK